MECPWSSIEARLLAGTPGRDIHIIKAAVPPPGEVNFQRAMGLPKRGSFLHFRRSVEGGGCLHVREYRRHYEVHWDRVDPRKRPLAHWWHDVRGGPHTLVGGAGLLALLAAWLLA